MLTQRKTTSETKYVVVKSVEYKNQNLDITTLKEKLADVAVQVKSYKTMSRGVVLYNKRSNGEYSFLGYVYNIGAVYGKNDYYTSLVFEEDYIDPSETLLSNLSSPHGRNVQGNIEEIKLTEELCYRYDVNPDRIGSFYKYVDSTYSICLTVFIELQSRDMMRIMDDIKENSDMRLVLFKPCGIKKEDYVANSKDAIKDLKRRFESSAIDELSRNAITEFYIHQLEK